MTWTLEILLPQELRKPGEAITCTAQVDENNEWQIRDLADERQRPLLELFAGLAEDGTDDPTVDAGYLPDRRPGARQAAPSIPYVQERHPGRPTEVSAPSASASLHRYGVVDLQVDVVHPDVEHPGAGRRQVTALYITCRNMLQD